MSTAELKTKIINEITESDDEELLRDVLRLLEIEGGDNDIYILSEEQERAISKAQDSVRAGKFLTEEEVNKKMDEWLGE